MGERLLSDLALYNARPTLRVDNQDAPLASRYLQSLEMREHEGGLSSLEAVFVNFGTQANGQPGLLFEDERLLALGSEIRVYAGDTATPTEIFCGIASALEFDFDAEGPPRLLLQAEDAAQKARLARRIEVYQNQSPADLARTIANRIGLTPVVSGLADTSAVEVQLNETDLAFLRRVLRRHEADLQVVAGELHVSPRASVQRNQIVLQMHSQLFRVRVVADLAHQVSSVTVTGFDPAQGVAVSGQCSSAQVGPGSGRQGSELLQSVFGTRDQQTSHRLALTQAEAQALAEAEFAQRARRFVRVEGRCEGNPALRVGSQLRLEGISPRFDNQYYVTACSHRYDMHSGYQTGFSAESAYLGNP